ncbi:MAG: TetR family transcriptional regulator [Propionibacteriaceae bacterium]|nr:TetR family transcriptional regulator [Propionibacteriaceae bacterium]
MESPRYVLINRQVRRYNQEVTTSLGRSTTKARRLPRAARREQILSAATQAFAAAGFADTSLDDIAEAAGVGRVILYRHFESKADLYRSVLDRAATRLGDSVGTDDFGEDAVPALVAAAAADPDGFRLLFRYAAREPEFRDVTDTLAAASVEVTRRNLVRAGVEPAALDWLSRLLPAITIEAVLSWLDAGQPQPDHAVARINRIVHAAMTAPEQPS